MNNPSATASTAHLRHALRTPLNHVIGYSEMIAEEIRDSVVPSESAWALPILEGIVANAKELVRFVQNALQQSSSELSQKQVKDLQSWLHPHALGMLAEVGELREINPEFGPDVDRVAGALRKLLAFCEGEQEALNEDAEVIREAAPKPVTGPSRGRLLVVDDSPHNRDLLRRSLERSGYSITTAADGATALEQLRQSVFDPILLDVIMPGMDGYTVLRELKKSIDLKDVPVIVISAVDESSAVVRCVEMGAEDYIMKPFDAVLVRVRVNAALDRWRARTRLALVGSALETLAAEADTATLHNEIHRLASLCNQENA